MKNFLKENWFKIIVLISLIIIFIFLWNLSQKIGHPLDSKTKTKATGLYRSINLVDCNCSCPSLEEIRESIKGY